MDITLVFMTNWSWTVPDITKQLRTIQSFYNVFKVDILPTIIYCDTKPLSSIEGSFVTSDGVSYDNSSEVGNIYVSNLLNIPEFRNARFEFTSSLCDGYLRALTCETKYLFFLEHDWFFKENITHSLGEQIELMNRNQEINCILFNKMSNCVYNSQKIYQVDYQIPMCLTDRQSNNPNILRVSHARQVRAPLISKDGCSIHPNIEFNYNMGDFQLPNYCGGIECELTNYCTTVDRVRELGTYLYGSVGMSCTVEHLDGCKRSLKTTITKQNEKKHRS